MRPAGSAATLLAALGLLGSVAAAQSRSDPVPIPPGDWPYPGRDSRGTRFSPLDRITPANVAGLKVLWTFATGSLGGHEAGPLVAGGRLFLVTPHPTSVYAFDLDRPGSSPVWRWQAPAGRQPTPAVCCGVTTRGLGWHPSGRVFVPLFTGDLVALDAGTGKEVWRVSHGDPAAGLTQPGAPLVVGDVVIVGVGGGEFGARAYLSAFDVNTGKQLWRAYSTGPDAEVLLPPIPNGNYSSHQGRNLGVTTWSGDSWRRGGGATWGWLSADPDLGLFFHGTGRPAPLNADQRLGDNKWTASLFARDPATGRARWVLQLTPGDRWGYGAAGESVPVDLTIGDRPVKALVHFDGNGFAYTLDRPTGRLLLAEKYGPVNWATRIDPGTAEPIRDSAFTPGSGRRRDGICPSLLGMRTLQPSAWSPATGLFYVPASNLCMDLEPVPAPFEPGRPFVGAAARIHPGPGGDRGRFLAWEPATGAIAWEVRERYPVLGGALATAGGLVFYGTLDGWVKALDAVTGRELWRFRAPSGIISAPISFATGDGKQYVALVSGVGGVATHAFHPASAGSASARLGLPGAFGDLGEATNPGGVLLVFGL